MNSAGYRAPAGNIVSFYGDWPLLRGRLKGFRQRRLCDRQLAAAPDLLHTRPHFPKSNHDHAGATRFGCMIAPDAFRGSGLGEIAAEIAARLQHGGGNGIGESPRHPGAGGIVRKNRGVCAASAGKASRTVSRGNSCVARATPGMRNRASYKSNRGVHGPVSSRGRMK